ncbi:MAG: hypothetical protein AB1772_02955 [Candidatus Zixiibacteriota bacterium]
MSKKFLPTVFAVAALVMVGCVDSALVAQGKVIASDTAAGSMQIEDERQPGLILTFDLSDADLGAAPLVDDLVRVAYHDDNGRLVAIRVMNLSHQTELRKKG